MLLMETDAWFVDWRGREETGTSATKEPLLYLTIEIE